LKKHTHTHTQTFILLFIVALFLLVFCYMKYSIGRKTSNVFQRCFFIVLRLLSLDTKRFIDVFSTQKKKNKTKQKTEWESCVVNYVVLLWRQNKASFKILVLIEPPSIDVHNGTLATLSTLRTTKQPVYILVANITSFQNRILT
jgi:hypothetical protein